MMTARKLAKVELDTALKVVRHFPSPIARPLDSIPSGPLHYTFPSIASLHTYCKIPSLLMARAYLNTRGLPSLVPR
jgi:hypothetical protein